MAEDILFPFQPDGCAEKPLHFPGQNTVISDSTNQHPKNVVDVTSFSLVSWESRTCNIAPQHYKTDSLGQAHRGWAFKEEGHVRNVRWNTSDGSGICLIWGVCLPSMKYRCGSREALGASSAALVVRKARKSPDVDP
ncbi:hypothetical protein HPB47_020081 [Ixodes persulcatus]|uniref:Uncharacterized protein n=1 Tax=Ixodes persulcatus TaxID=34615 RepID=A0AC60QH90_IXOPE|nr:hypothetical protein HPB47_020081 [Ixodes persulcatus]